MAAALASSAPWRLELFYKSADELAAQVPFLRSHGIRRLNLPNKRPEDDLAAAVAALAGSSIPGLDICVHYSIKYNYERSPAAAAARLERLYGQLHAACPPDVRLSLLLVSGGGQKKRYESVAALQQLARRHQPLPLPLHVAFNPYLPAQELELELERLRQKLSTRAVSGVYLQVGSDLAALEAGLQYAARLMDELYGPHAAAGAKAEGQAAPARPALHGSVFLPSARLLSQMRFRPWNGVFLSDEYLGSVEAAERITRQQLRLYARYGVVPLVETSVRNSKELAYAFDLLQEAAPAAGK